MGNKYKVTAPGIVAELQPTDANHIYFDANHHSGMGRGFPTAHYIEIRGITYGISAHFYKWADGTWNHGQEEDSYGVRLYGLYMSRAGRKDASDAARLKAIEIMTEIVRKWASENPDAFVAAEREAVKEKRGKIQKRISELQAQIDAYTAEMQALDAQLQ
jgi:hypothetical protein